MKTETYNELVGWIDGVTKGLQLPGDRRSRIASACFDVVVEHLAAIALLNKSELFGSMYALLRVVFEAFVRGAWLLHSATENELDLFQKDELKRKFSDLIKDVETKLGAQNSALTSIHGSSWDAMNSFTHTGFMQVVRRMSADRTGSNYDPKEVSALLGIAGVLGLFAGFELAAIAGDEKVTRTILDRYRSLSHPNNAP